MKIINKISVLLSAVLFAALLTSCSEFMLIPISIDYPFDEKNQEASPSSYKINITEGLRGVETIFNQKVPEVTRELFSKLPIEGGDNAEITGFPKFAAQDILDLIAGKTVRKEIEFKIPVINEFKHEQLAFSICDFDASDFDEKDSATNTIMTIANLADFCGKTEAERDDDIERCQREADETCLHLSVIQENESLIIKMAEQKDLKKYKKYLNKIYSATLNDFRFIIKNAPNLTAGNNAFRLKAELYAQAIDPFRPDTDEHCKDGDDLKLCTYKGVDNDGNPDDYFAPAEGHTYLIGEFKTDDTTYSADEVMNLLYTYEGKDILQHAIKHLDFQLGIKSFYEFYPQALDSADNLVLEASIKAKFLFNVEPLN